MTETGEGAGWKAARILGEPLIALALASFGVGLLSLPFLPSDSRVHVRLPAPESGAPTPDEALELVREAALARTVRIDSREEGGSLVLAGVADPPAAEARLHELLDRDGSPPIETRSSDVVDLDALLGGNLGDLPALLSVQAAVFLGVGVLARRIRVRPRREPRSGLLLSALSGLAAGIVALLVSAIVSIALDALGLKVEEQEWVQRMFRDRPMILRLAPWIVLVGPLAEEVFFRGYVLPAVAQDLGQRSGLAFSSILFAAVHFNPSGLAVYLVLGVVFGWAYQRSGRLLTPILAHVTLNSAVLLRAALEAS